MSRAALSDALYLDKKQFDKILLIVAMGKQRGIDTLRLHAIHNLLKPFSGMIGQKEIRYGIKSVEDIIFQKNILAAALIREETLIELYHKAFLRMLLVERKIFIQTILLTMIFDMIKGRFLLHVL